MSNHKGEFVVRVGAVYRTVVLASDHDEKVATLEAENAKLRAELERTATWIEDLPVPTVGAAGQLVRIDKVLAAAPSAPKADEYRCRKCGEKTPPPEPYKAYVLCDCGYMTSATAAIAAARQEGA